MSGSTTIGPRPAPSRALGYQFTPLPVALLEDRRQGHLIDRDLVVAAEMLAIGRWAGRADSCWCTKAVIARRLDVSLKTVQNAWRRLRARGWILEVPTGDVDPEDPRNRTGRRYHFGWAAGPMALERRGEEAIAPRGEEAIAPNKRGNPSPEKTTDAVVVSTGPGTRDTNPAPCPMPDIRTASIEPAAKAGAPPLPAPLADALASPAIGEPLRRQIGRLIPRWLAAHPAERVAAALRAMIEAARHRRVKSPIGYLVGTLRNMEVEDEKPSELAPPSLPRRTPDAERTAERLAEIRRGECEAADRERRWAALPASERRAIEARDEAENPRPAGTPGRLWAMMRHAACLEMMDVSSGEPRA